MEAYIQNVIFLLIFLIFKGLHFSGLYILECMISYSLRCQLGFWFVMFLILFLILIVFLSSYLGITSHTLRNHALSSLQPFLDASSLFLFLQKHHWKILQRHFIPQFSSSVTNFFLSQKKFFISLYGEIVFQSSMSNNTKLFSYFKCCYDNADPLNWNQWHIQSN